MQPDCPRLKGNLQGSKAKALIVQSPVAFFVVVTQSSECGLLYKEKKKPKYNRSPDGPRELHFDLQLCWLA